MNKQIVSIFFSICALTSVYGLQAMRPRQGQVVDWNKKLETEIGQVYDINSETVILECLGNGANVNNKVNSEGDTLLYMAIKNLSKKDSREAYLFVNFWIIKTLLEHGAEIDQKSAKLSKELIENNNSVRFIELDKLIKLVRGYEKNKSNRAENVYDRENYILDSSMVSSESFIFLVRVSFGRSLQVVNMNTNLGILDTIFGKIWQSLVGEHSAVFHKFFGVKFGGSSEVGSLDSLVKAIAQKEHYYLRPNFFSPVKTTVVQKPVVPAKPKGLVVSPVKQEEIVIRKPFPPVSAKPKSVVPVEQEEVVVRKPFYPVVRKQFPNPVKKQVLEQPERDEFGNPVYTVKFQNPVKKQAQGESKSPVYTVRFQNPEKKQVLEQYGRDEFGNPVYRVKFQNPVKKQ